MYSEKVIEHFQNPHNYGRIENPDGIGEVGNMKCGDIMKLYIKLKGDAIEDIKFETFGCAAAIATSSVVTDLAKGKSIEDALKINAKDVVDSLGGLPNIKVHCSLLAIDALSEAVYDYYKNTGKEISEDLKKKHESIKKRDDE
ncbi:MAG: iron-sulfur cluster assembly scaffold protein [Candidatus Nealsonbacteria bacterium RIFOXYB1_FULL_40_15]|uniref:Iron-sulfur cluster assembly scaffold protein n=1 Tax=Candidatus Nealsonbacteria bacterium RIFOXYB1_FULL_40_15 TaxID=1801677 RepID=A0A1G2ENM1_9BACT|nr:MAG: iron-sulfur cluster assembly scaffold protein [Candidatus Nealsonbacteria bacterium RIFOXYB1_FULL_40_15]OGZ29846.1 MAG: iron-sulfur cluster assembly scaffold protein [Candidatus Nealsonbacteria bacterium RIFOXYD1_FULL_39_11]